MVDIAPGLHGLKGGQKRHWLLLHRDEVLAYASAHGAGPVRERYLIKKDFTWDALLRGYEPRTVYSKYQQAVDLAKDAMSSSREVRVSNNELRAEISQAITRIGNQSTITINITLPPALIVTSDKNDGRLALHEGD
jgi:hypothetical protein